MKKFKLFFSAAFIVVLVFALAACGGAKAPGFAMKPDTDPDKLMEKLEKDGWDVSEMLDEDGTGMIIATKGDEPGEDADENTKVSGQTLMIMYVANKAGADAYYTMMEAALKIAKEAVPKGVSFSYSLSKTEYSVSVWVSVSGKLGDMEGWDPGFDF